MHWILSILISIAYAVICLGWGLLLVWAFRHYLNKLTSHEEFIAAPSILFASYFLAGVAVISAILTILGLIGQLRSLPLILALLPGAVGLILGRKYIHDFIFASLEDLSAYRLRPLWLVLIAGFTVLLALGSGIGAWFLPPKGDAAAFYMVYPKIIAATGLLEPMHGPFYFFSVIGLPVELHYAALMVLADEHAAKFIMFPIAVSVGVMLVGIVRLCGGGIAAVTLGWAMLFSSYTFHHYIYDGKVDLAAAAFGLAAVYWLLRGTESRISLLACCVAGWFAGLATAAKFPYILVLGVSLFVLLAWRVVVSHSNESKLWVSSVNLARVSGLMIIGAVVAWLPHLLKNGMLFDAPLAPFLGGQSDGNLLSQVWFSPEDTEKILLTYPLALVFGRYPMQGGGLSFLFLAFLPFLIWLSRTTSWRRSVTVAVTIAGFAGVLAWMVFRPSVIAPRYILASLLLFVPILAIATEDVLVKKVVPPVLRAGTTLTILLAIAASFWHLLPIPSAIIQGINSTGNSCSLAKPECESFQKLADIARPGDRIFVASYYPYWLTPDQLQCRDTLEEHRAIHSKTQLLSWLQSRDFSYVVVDSRVFNSLAQDLEQLVSHNPMNVTKLHDNNLIYVFEIKKDNPRNPRCRETSSGRWYIENING